MTTALALRHRGWIWLGVVCLAVWPTLASFHDVWTSYDYSHGYLAAAVAIWLGWRNLRNGVPGERDGLSALAPVAVVGLSLTWLVATVLHYRVVHQGVLPLMLVAWAAMVGGRRGALRTIPPASLVLFAVPFWEVFVPPLQALTVLVSGSAVRLMGIGAEISGDIITIPSGRFEVAGSCSGLNYFIVGGFLGTTYAHLFVKPWKGRLKVMILAVATAIVANWVRVVGLVVVGHVTRMQHSLMAEHHTYGWVVFGLFMGGWLWLVERQASRASLAPGRVATPQASAAPAVWSRRSAMAILLVLLGPTVYWVVTAVPPQPIDTYASEAFPRDGWVAANSAETAFDWGLEYPGADVHQRWVLQRDSTSLIADRVTYLEQEQGREISGGSNRIANPDWVVGERTRWVPSLNHMVRETLVEAPGRRTLLWSWYEVGGQPAATRAGTEALALRGFFLRRLAARVIVVRAECAASSCTRAAGTLANILSGADHSP